MSNRPQPPARETFPWFYTLSTRWGDNDIYGHVNNVVYYAYFDTAVNRYLIEEGGLNPAADNVVGYVVHSEANYFAPIAHPAELQVGLKVARLGARSVTWAVGVFLPDDQTARVLGGFTHAFVDRRTQCAADVPPAIRTVLEPLCP